MVIIVKDKHTPYTQLILWRNENRHILNNYIVDKNVNSWDKDPLLGIKNPIRNINQSDYAPTLMHNEALTIYRAK